MIDSLHTVAFCSYAMIDHSIITLIQCFNIISYSTCLVVLYIVSQHFDFAILINIIFYFTLFIEFMKLDIYRRKLYFINHQHT